MDPNRMNLERKEFDEVVRPSEVVCIPDIHADPDALHSSLICRGLVDKNGLWAGRDTVLQFSGDYIDKGPSNIHTLAYLNRLAKSAAEKGARIDFLVGNHEAMMLRCLLTPSPKINVYTKSWLKNGGTAMILEYAAHTHPSAAFVERLELLGQSENKVQVTANFAILTAHHATELARHLDIIAREMLAPRGSFYEFFSQLKPFSQVDDILYVHAGINLEWAEKLANQGVDGLNQEWQTAIESAKKGDFKLFDNFSKPGFSRSNNAGEVGGPLWADFKDELETLLDHDVAKIAKYLKSIGINAIVVGHRCLESGQAEMAANFARHGIKLIACDVGLSSYFNSGVPGEGSLSTGTDGSITGHSMYGSNTLYEKPSTN